MFVKRVVNQNSTRSGIKTPKKHEFELPCSLRNSALGLEQLISET